MGSIVDCRRFALCAIYSSFGFAMLAEARHRPEVGVLALLGCMSAILGWVTLDAHVHGKALHHGWALAFTSTWPVSLPIYLVWTRGRRGLVTYAAAIGLCIAMGIVAALLDAVLR